MALVRVTQAAIHALDAILLNFIFKKLSWNSVLRILYYYSDETIKMAIDATLFGAVTTVPGQKSAIFTLRKNWAYC